MTNSGAGFKVSRPGEKIEIELRVRAGGETYSLVHEFREPSAADKLDFWRDLSMREPGSGDRESGPDYLGANRVLYDRCIESVRGYDLPEDAAADSAWRELVPLEHKLWAVEKLLSRAGSLSEQSVKN